MPSRVRTAICSTESARRIATRFAVGGTQVAELSQDQVDLRGLGEFGRGPEPAPHRVEPQGQLLDGRAQQIGRTPVPERVQDGARTGARPDDRPGGDGRGQFPGLLLDLAAAVVPDVVEGGEDRRERGEYRGGHVAGSRCPRRTAAGPG